MESHAINIGREQFRRCLNGAAVIAVEQRETAGMPARSPSRPPIVDGCGTTFDFTESPGIFHPSV